MALYQFSFLPILLSPSALFLSKRKRLRHFFFYTRHHMQAPHSVVPRILDIIQTIRLSFSRLAVSNFGI